MGTKLETALWRQRGAFSGCSRFPGCDFTRKQAGTRQAEPQRSHAQRITVPVHIGDRCPVCKKGCIQKKNSRHGPFLGCSRFREGCKAKDNLLRCTDLA
ncbi:MAG: topoisomerase DNA-binding C4 zinc finger domain-containing protein [Stenotrophomonas sp.]|uniref:topoisomerase DNA-binding C4 zinc finger domain-containing protein n=1 Tax=Stenotrophomonas sp. TaxID=69392 RepID=UPI003D6C9B2B